MAKNMIRRPFPRGGIRTRLPVTIYRRASDDFSPTEIEGLALWLDASSSDLYTTDAGPVTGVASPLDIAGCALWLDASDAASITESGGLVSQWSDKSGNNRHATASSTARPTTGTRTVGGKNAMDFNGTVNSMATGGSAFPTAATHTVFLVYQLDSASQSRTSVLLTAATIGDQEIRVAGFGSTAVQYVFNNNLGTTMASSAIGLGPIVLSAREATASMRSAGAGVVSTTSGSAFAWSSGSMLIGSRTAGNYVDGLLCEVIIYPTTLTDSQTASVESYLAAKWSISGVHAPATATSDPVGYWGDKSGNGRHAVQATAGSRPTVSATALNGKKQLGLVSQHLRGPSTTWTGSASIYWVGKTGQATNGAIVFGDGTVDQTDSFHAGWINTQGVGAFGNGWGGGNAPRAESPSAWRNADIVAGVTFSSTESVARVNGATTNTVAALTGTLSQASAAQFYIGRESTNVWNNLNGSLAEVLIYQPALNASQRARLERYLAAKYGITLAPQVANADAQDWINRVYANGGTVSSATAASVNQFCVDLENAPGGSIRDRFFRLNLFCGSFQGAFVPLFRGPSLGGTQYGGTTDLNLGSPAFLDVTDYQERGASGGLLGNGSTKYLNTGFNVDQLPGAANCHLSSYITGTQDIATPRTLIGTLFNGVADRYRIFLNNTTAGNYLLFTELGVSSQASATRANANGGLMLASRTSTTLLTLYDDAVSVGTNETSTSAVTGASPFFVFARNGPVEFYNGRMAAYSIGAGMTAAQVTAYNTAMQSFQSAMTRSI